LPSFLLPKKESSYFCLIPLVDIIAVEFLIAYTKEVKVPGAAV
jgi:hypothetical protein